MKFRFFQIRRFAPPPPHTLLREDLDFASLKPFSKG
jgi:hypothetical protein